MRGKCCKESKGIRPSALARRSRARQCKSQKLYIISVSALCFLSLDLIRLEDRDKSQSQFSYCSFYSAETESFFTSFSSGLKDFWHTSTVILRRGATEIINALRRGSRPCIQFIVSDLRIRKEIAVQGWIGVKLRVAKYHKFLLCEKHEIDQPD